MAEVLESIDIEASSWLAKVQQRPGTDQNIEDEDEQKFKASREARRQRRKSKLMDNDIPSDTVTTPCTDILLSLQQDFEKPIVPSKTSTTSSTLSTDETQPIKDLDPPKKISPKDTPKNSSMRSAERSNEESGSPTNSPNRIVVQPLNPHKKRDQSSENLVDSTQRQKAEKSLKETKLKEDVNLKKENTNPMTVADPIKKPSKDYSPSPSKKLISTKVDDKIQSRTELTNISKISSSTSPLNRSNAQPSLAHTPTANVNVRRPNRLSLGSMTQDSPQIKQPTSDTKSLGSQWSPLSISRSASPSKLSTGASSPERGTPLSLYSRQSSPGSERLKVRDILNQLRSANGEVSPVSPRYNTSPTHMNKIDIFEKLASSGSTENKTKNSTQRQLPVCPVLKEKPSPSKSSTDDVQTKNGSTTKMSSQNEDTVSEIDLIKLARKTCKIISEDNSQNVDRATSTGSTQSNVSIMSLPEFDFEKPLKSPKKKFDIQQDQEISGDLTNEIFSTVLHPVKIDTQSLKSPEVKKMDTPNDNVKDGDSSLTNPLTPSKRSNSNVSKVNFFPKESSPIYKATEFRNAKIVKSSSEFLKSLENEIASNNNEPKLADPTPVNFEAVAENTRLVEKKEVRRKPKGPRMMIKTLTGR